MNRGTFGETSRRARRASAHGLALALAAFLCGSCQGRDRWPVIATQRWPGPMPSAVDPLPPGVDGLHPPGIEEVLVLRHADPVQVQPAGQPAAFPLFFYDKQRRLNAGSWVYSAPGGRAELIWPNGASLLLFGRCSGVIGSPLRGEPSFTFREIEGARLHPRPGVRYQLLGGALLEADEGPFRLERRENGVLRVHSQAQVSAEIVYREEAFRLDPGQVLDLPLVEPLHATGPPPAGVYLVQGPGFEISIQGPIDVTSAAGGVLVIGRGEHEARALGVRVRGEAGERILFTGLGSGSDAGLRPTAADPGDEVGDEVGDDEERAP